jgi:hypothetical protein
MLGPLRLFTDPILKLVGSQQRKCGLWGWRPVGLEPGGDFPFLSMPHIFYVECLLVTKDNENTEKFIKSRVAKSLEKKREVEDEEIGARREKEDKERDY